MEENKKIYINDLEQDNKCYFAQNEGVKTKIKEYKKELDVLLRKGFAHDVLNRTWFVVSTIKCLYEVIRLNNKSIKDNMDKIRGLRNGTKQEI